MNKTQQVYQSTKTIGAAINFYPWVQVTVRPEQTQYQDCKEKLALDLQIPVRTNPTPLHTSGFPCDQDNSFVVFCCLNTNCLLVDQAIVAERISGLEVVRLLRVKSSFFIILGLVLPSSILSVCPTLKFIIFACGIQTNVQCKLHVSFCEEHTSNF